MELVIALFGGAVGGSLICSISPKITISRWISLFGGMLGGAGLFLIVSKWLSPDLAPTAETVNLGSLLTLMVIGFAGGVLALMGLCIWRWCDRK